jgi:hypothetical protein
MKNDKQVWREREKSMNAWEQEKGDIYDAANDEQR